MDSPVVQLRKFLSQGSKQGEVSLVEFSQWWKTLSDSEKDEFKTAVGLWDGKSEFIPPSGVPATDNQSAVTVVAA